MQGKTLSGQLWMSSFQWNQSICKVNEWKKKSVALDKVCATFHAFNQQSRKTNFCVTRNPLPIVFMLIEDLYAIEIKALREKVQRVNSKKWNWIIEKKSFLHFRKVVHLLCWLVAAVMICCFSLPRSFTLRAVRFESDECARQIDCSFIFCLKILSICLILVWYNQSKKSSFFYSSSLLCSRFLLPCDSPFVSI